MIFWQILGLVVSAVIFWRAESALNLMSRATLARMSRPRGLFLRAAFCLLATGGAALALQITQGYAPPPAIVLLLAGVALLLLTERRIRGLLRIYAPLPFDRRASP